MQIRQKKIYPEETCDNLLIYLKDGYEMLVEVWNYKIYNLTSRKSLRPSNVKEWIEILKKRIKDTKVKDQKRKKRRRKNIIGKKW